MSKFPEKFKALHEGEEFVRARSIEAIANSADLTLHLDLIEKAADLIYYFIHRDTHRDDDDLTIRLLGIRMFNGLNATLKLLLSGYYQASTLQQRDIIETFFLLDYFSGDKSLVARWRTIGDATRQKEFKPIAVREKLDSRGGFAGKKRAELYKLFSTLAGHPHPAGFQMIRLPNGEHHCGPFFDATSLSATLSELGKSAAQAGGIFGPFFDHPAKLDLETKLSFLEAQQAWLTRFFGNAPINQTTLDEMRAQIDRLNP